MIEEITVTSTLKTILIIDDDESARQLITHHINQTLPEVRVEEYDPAVHGPPPSTFDWEGCDLIILDYLLDGKQTGLDLLQEWKKQDNFPPVIMLTGKGSEDVAVRAMKTGVQDYLRKQDITAERLRQSIMDVAQNYKLARERPLSSTSQSFNKALFYKKLEQALQSNEPTAVFFLIEVDNYDHVGEEVGIILQDDVIRHVAKITFEAFGDPDYQASITRMSDSTIGLLFEPPESWSLEEEVAKLNDILTSNPYDYEGELIPLIINVGVVFLKHFSRSANEIIRCARIACQKVRAAGGDGYAIYTETMPITVGATEINTGYKYRDKALSTDERPEPKSDHRFISENDDTEPPEESVLELTLELPGEKVQADHKSSASGKAGTVDLGEAESAMDDEFDIMQALTENRILQYFQPIMPLSEVATSSNTEFFSIFVRMVATDGTIIPADKVIDSLRNVRNQKLLDRWMLREGVGRVLQLSQQTDQRHLFLIKISDESVADANLFNWLQNKLMKRVAKQEPSKSIIIEVTADTYLSKPRQIEALFKYLRQTYGFRFAIAAFKDIEQLQKCVKKKRFDIYVVNYRLLHQLYELQAHENSFSPVVSDIKQQNSLLIATHIESAGMLTEAISAGADFAIGYFIGEPVDHIGEMTQVESYEIT